MDGSGDGYLRTVCDYVHLNPARAQLIASEARLESFRWSSYPACLHPPRQRPHWLRVDRLLGEKGIARDSAAGRKEFSRLTERRRWAENATDYESVRRGWYLGSEDFRRELLAAAAERVGASHCGADRRETGEEKAGRIVQEELRRRGWKEEDLPGRRKGDKVKVVLAHRLRRETTMTLKWIARRLHMGSWTYVSNLLHEKEKP